MTVAGDTSQELCPRASGSPATGGGLEISYKATPVPTRTSLPKGRVLAICSMLDLQSWRRASSGPPDSCGRETSHPSLQMRM